MTSSMNLTEEDMANNQRRYVDVALRISMIYAGAGALWILFSDTVLSLFISDPAALTHLQTFKGWAFIAVTAFLLYFVVRRYMSAMRRAELALQESEKAYRILVETAASAIFLYRDTFITVNRAMEELTGYSAGELTSMRFYDLLYPEFREMIRAQCDALSRGNAEPVLCEMKIRTKTGEERWIDFTSSIIDYQGKQCGLGTAFDITGRKLAEQSLKESEERLRLLVQRIRDYEIFMLDREGRIVFWNVGAERSKGYSPDEIIGSHHSLFFTREDIEAGVPDTELKMAAAEGSFEDEGWRVRKDGSLFWANVVTTAVRDNDGVLRGFSKVIRDISDRKIAEEALRESEERYRIIAETASDVLITIDEQSTVQFVNPAAERIFGYRPEELMGQNMTLIVPERLRNAHHSAMKRYVETGERTINWGSVELPGLHKSGREVPLEISYGEFAKLNSRFFTGIIRDITERKDAAKNKEYRDMLERFNQELENIVAERTMNLLAMTLADRVRNPASVIGATANRLLRKEEISDRLRENLELISSETGKLDRTVRDFQDLIKGRQGLFHYEDVCSIVRDIVPVIEREALRKHINLSICLPDDPLRINTERNLLKMAIFTLMKNAVELTPDEGAVTVSVTGDDNSIRIVIADNGYGIPREEIDAIFDPFTHVRTYSFGMGLPLIKQIVSEHMGEISVQSGIGEGTTVTMIFPVRWSGIDGQTA